MMETNFNFIIAIFSYFITIKILKKLLNIINKLKLTIFNKFINFYYIFINII